MPLCDACGRTEFAPSIHVEHLEANDSTSPVVMAHHCIISHPGDDILCLECACSNPDIVAADPCGKCREAVAALTANTGRP